MIRICNWVPLSTAAVWGCMLFLVLAACSKNNREEPAAAEGFNSKMKDQAYVGKTTSKLYIGGYDPLPSVEGSGSFNIDRIKGDSSTAALLVDLSTGGGFTFGIPGKQEGMSWQSTFADASTSIKANGEMDAKIVAAGKEITWDGRLFDDKLVLDIRIKYLEAEGEIPAESILHTRMDLVNPAGGEPNGNGSGCTVIVWESRAVFNIYAGGVDLISVPVCR